MTRDPDLPLLPDDDPAVDRLLSAAGRFSPQRGFEERVVARVRVPLPQWARYFRDRWRALTRGVPGWTMLATFSLATATAWGVGAAAGVREWDSIAGPLRIAWAEARRTAGVVISEGVVPGWQLTSAEVSAWLQSFGLDPRTVLLGYGAVILICAVALRRLTAEPAKRRGAAHAAS